MNTEEPKAKANLSALLCGRYGHSIDRQTNLCRDCGQPADSVPKAVPQTIVNAIANAKTSIKSTFVKVDDYVSMITDSVKAGLNVLLIGPKGTGKTETVEHVFKQLGRKLYTVNCSVRTRESHLIGSTELVNGNTQFREGIVVKALRDGAGLYLDELNTLEGDTAVRLDEVLDDRKQCTLKESNDQIVKAENGFTVIATINPLSHTGTKELPAQIVSRFPVRIYFDYPDSETELAIVKAHVDNLLRDQIETIKQAIKLSADLRKSNKSGDLSYSPSIRETIAFAILLKAGVTADRIARMIYVDVYGQYGESELLIAKNMIAVAFTVGA